MTFLLENNITTSAIINPLLYVIAFGWGLGADVQVEGTTYMHFVIPGIIALSTMNTSFSAVSVRVNISRLYEKSFEYYLTSPVNMKLLALGQILSGAFRGMYASMLVLFVSFIFGIYIPINFSFIFVRCSTNYELKYMVMNIKVLGTGCSKCKSLENATREAVAEMGIVAEVEKIEDIVKIMQYGVMRTPALVINEKVVISGSLPSVSAIKELIAKNQ